MNLVQVGTAPVPLILPAPLLMQFGCLVFQSEGEQLLECLILIAKPAKGLVFALELRGSLVE